MKKFVLFVLCLAIMAAGPAYGAVVFDENFETGSSPFSFAWKWTKGNAYNEGSLVTESGNRFWREIFKPGSTDTYFGFTTDLTGASAITNTLYFRFKVRYGDSAHPYRWTTADRSHELKFPDLCPGMAGNGDRARIICKHRRGSDDSHGIFRVYTPIDAYNHDLPTQLTGNRWYTIQFMIQDNGSNGDVVKIWLDNDNQNSPNYSYTAQGKDMFDGAGGRWRNYVEWAYRNHAVASDMYFYFDEISISTTFITGSGSPPPPPTCSYGINPTSLSFDGAAHTGSFSVTSQTECAWTATSNASWITITSGGSGSGNGTVAYSITANSGASQRSGTITAAGRTYTITQAAGAAACTYSLSPANTNFDSAAHTGSFNVSAQSACQWTATPSTSWITITSGGSGSGNGTVSYSVAANSGTSQRSGTITVAGRTYTITQASATPPATCTYGITPTSVNVDSAARNGSLSVSTQSVSCQWTARSNAGWITITSGSSGSGAGVVNYSLAANTSSSSRTGTITAAGMTFTVRQAASVTPPPVSCTYNLGESSEVYNGDFHTGSVNVSTSSSNCTWTAKSNVDWITITSGSSGTGSGTVTYSIEKNSRFFHRIGTLTIAGKTYTVRQGSILSSWLPNPFLRAPSRLRVQ